MVCAGLEGQSLWRIYLFFVFLGGQVEHLVRRPTTRAFPALEPPVEKIPQSDAMKPARVGAGASSISIAARDYPRKQPRERIVGFL